ncbi:MAG: flagellar biosynthesis anti-sigma factor FlgM [Amphritea sp.]|nr:flagellar biosynthesis anti-sigma factor FlgM [Amphritea sp.]
MVIDITSLTSNQATNSRAKVNEQPASESKAQTAQATNESAPAASSVNLSDAAQAIQKGAGELASSDVPVNEQRVAELKAAIDNGTYQIDFESTARGLLQIENQLG